MGTVTLTTAAPTGGITINLSTSDKDTARPTVASVTVPAGSTTATFNIETTTVSSSEDVQITAQYLSVGINVILRVTIFPPVARFTVTGPNHGANTCTITDGNGGLDCTADATTSGGVPQYYLWSYTIASTTDVDTTAQPINSDLFLKDGCGFFSGRSTNNDGMGNTFLSMDIGLVIQDREGTLSPKTTHTVMVYTNGFCGY